MTDALIATVHFNHRHSSTNAAVEVVVDKFCNTVLFVKLSNQTNQVGVVEAFNTNIGTAQLINLITFEAIGFQ